MCLLKLYKAKTTFVYRSPTPHQNSPTLGGATIAFSLETDLSTRLYPPPSVLASVHAGSEAL